MLIFLICFVPIIFFGMKISAKGTFFDDYISPKQTAAINGIFTLLIFFSHISTYITLDGKLDASYVIFKNYLGQLVVVSFLFYSGFGIMESIKKKGFDYVKGIPTKRFFKVLYHFDLAILLFIVVNLILGNQLKTFDTLFAFIGWSSVGNSNWYIFVVLALYLLVFISFMLARGNKYAGTILMSVLSVGFVLLLFAAGKESHWYNTLIVYPVGMIFSLIKDKFNSIVAKKDMIWLICTVGTLVLFVVFEHFRGKSFVIYELGVISFAMVLVLFTMKFKIGNKILNWFGAHVFSIYILQRLPMMIFEKVGLAESHKYIYVVICFAVTLGLASLFDIFTGRLDSLLYKGKSKKISAS